MQSSILLADLQTLSSTSLKSLCCILAAPLIQRSMSQAHLLSAFSGAQEDGEAAGPGKSGVERKRAWVVEHLAGACSLPAISASSLDSVVHYLTLQAFFEVDPAMVSPH